MAAPLADTPLAPRFLVHAKWAEAYFRKGLKAKVVNEPLVDHARGCHACDQILLRRGLSQGADFWVLDADMWASLQRNYGSDYTLRRKYTAPPPPRVVFKVELAPVQRAKKPCPTPTPAARLELDVHPTMSKLYYWDDAKGDAVVCRHRACGHEVLVDFTPTSQSVEPFTEIARGAIHASVALGVETHRQIAHYKVDLLVWHFGWKLWVLWRAGRDFKLPTDATALRSPASGSFRVCIRRKMDALEADAHLEEVKTAKKVTAKKKAATTQRHHVRAGSKKALGKRHRHDDEEDDEGEDEEDESKEPERDQDDSNADSAGDSDSVVEFGSSGELDTAAEVSSPSMAADADDSQSTVDTQPATVTAPVTVTTSGHAADVTVGNDQPPRVSTPMATMMETMMQAIK